MIPYPLLVAGFIAAIAGVTLLARRSVPSARAQDEAFNAWMATGGAQPGWPGPWAWATAMPDLEPEPEPEAPLDPQQLAMLAAAAQMIGRPLTATERLTLLARWEQAGRPAIPANVTAQVRS